MLIKANSNKLQGPTRVKKVKKLQVGAHVQVQSFEQGVGLEFMKILINVFQAFKICSS